MITTADTFVLYEGDKVAYNGLDIYAVPTVYDEDTSVSVQVRILSDAGGIAATLDLTFTNTEIAAFTGSGTTDRDKFFNQVEQAVVDHLEGITDNSGATFTIA